jgi:hypothetical protein
MITRNSVYSCYLGPNLADIDNQEIDILRRHHLDRDDEDVLAIRVVGGTVPFIVAETFSYFPNIFMYIVEPNQDRGINRIQTGAFTNAKNLQWLWISYNPLATIQANAFVGATALRTLDLRNNQIERISVFAFNGLSSLRDLMLENNRIFQIQGNLFKPLTNIELIYLTDNQIESIEGRTFATNRQLRHVDITRNPIQEIESSVIDGIENLEIFVAAENVCVSDAWVEEPIEIIREGLKLCFENFDKIQ